MFIKNFQIQVSLAHKKFKYLLLIILLKNDRSLPIINALKTFFLNLFILKSSSFFLLNTSVEISEIFPVKEEDLLKKIKNDLYVRESFKLFVEMLSFKES